MGSLPKSVTLNDLERRNGVILRYLPNSVAFRTYYRLGLLKSGSR